MHVLSQWQACTYRFPSYDKILYIAHDHLLFDRNQRPAVFHHVISLQWYHNREINHTRTTKYDCRKHFMTWLWKNSRTIFTKTQVFVEAPYFYSRFQQTFRSNIPFAYFASRFVNQAFDWLLLSSRPNLSLCLQTGLRILKWTFWTSHRSLEYYSEKVAEIYCKKHIWQLHSIFTNYHIVRKR